MRLIFGLLGLTLMLFLKEIETSNLRKLSLGTSKYSEEDSESREPPGTSRVSNYFRRKSKKPQSSAGNEALNLATPYDDTAYGGNLLLDLAGQSQTTTRRKSSNRDSAGPAHAMNPLLQFADTVENNNHFLATIQGNQGEPRPQTHLREKKKRGKLPNMPNAPQMNPYGNYGYGYPQDPSFQGTQSSYSEDPYQGSYHSSSEHHQNWQQD